MKTKTHVIIPLTIVTSENLSPAAKTVYAVLKTFQKGKTAAHLNPSVVVTYAEIVTRSNLSKTTVMKALNQIKANGWIDWETNSGSANRYIFITPSVVH
jgi:DNA-binding GntR family transcriptional regulator